MTVGLNNTTLLTLPLPVEGYFDGSWGDLVNFALTDYLDIAIAGTLTLTGDGAVTLANTAGGSTGTNIDGTTAQYAVIKITGTLTTTKVITAPSTSKVYFVDNAATGGTVTLKATGQTGISIAVGEKCSAYFNGTDYVKIASSVADGVTSVGGTGTVNGITLSGAVTSTGNLTLGGTLSGVSLTSQVTGTLPVANGGTGVTTSTGTGNTVLSTSPTLVTPILGTPQSVTLTSATGLPLTTGVTGILPIANGGTATATPGLVQGSGVTISGSWPNQTIAATGTGGTITSVTASSPLASSGGTTPNITLSSSTGSGAVVLATSPTLVTPLLGTPTSGNLANCTFPTLNQNTTGTAASTPKLLTTNFTVQESGGKLYFYYGATAIASMDSSGNLIALANATAYGTP